jgi:hypothetical protein
LPSNIAFKAQEGEEHMLKKIIYFALILFLAQVGPASAQNLLTNGSFETGDLTGWTSTGTYSGYPVSVIVTNGITGSAFGEAVPADTVVGGSPDVAGTYAAYFVDDHANQVLSQSVYLTAGSYEIGFDSYSPLNGYNNPGDASFSGTIAGVTLANYDVKTGQAPQVWVNYSGIADVSVSGFYQAAFDFQTFGGASADVVIDRVYIESSSSGGGIPIPPTTTPEPATMLLLGLGLMGLAGVRRKLTK